MTVLLTAAQMGAIEQAAIDSGEVTGLELMERAGRGVVAAIFEEWPELAPAPGGGAAPTPPGYLGNKEGARAVILCGPGNNGGDGFVVARLLSERGWGVEVFLYGDAGKLPPNAKVNYGRWLEIGAVADYWQFDATATFRDLTVDALFGTGMTRPLEPAALHGEIVGSSSRMLAVDMPTGLATDTGNLMAPSYRADLTVTFHRAKRGHFLAGGPRACGRLGVVSIGLERFDRAADHRATVVRLVAGPERRLLQKEGEHKFALGHALILSGGVGKGGAARLAARGALRIGAGVVTVGCPPAALQENAGALDAIMVRPVKGAEGLAEVLQDARINALCLGPGLGVDRAAKMVAVALGGGGVAPRPTVLDADALTAIAGDAGLFKAVHNNCVLTPHAGEFARLFPDIAEKLNAPATKGPAYSKVDATREAAARAGCVVLFKGADTVIADPSGGCSINSAHYERSAPWLATAGSGDVLAGFITGLLARGFAPMQAAETGAWLHVECALKFGPGLIAEDLPEQLPAVFRDLGV